MKKQKNPGAKAAKKARLADQANISPALNGAADDASTNVIEIEQPPAQPEVLSFGQRLVANLNASADSVLQSGQKDAAAIAAVLKDLAADETLEILEPGDGVLDYLIRQGTENTSFLLKPVITNEIKKAREAAINPPAADGEDLIANM